MSEIPLNISEIDEHIAIVRENLRELMEQAAAYSGAADEELMWQRIAGQESKLALLTRQREKLSRLESHHIAEGQFADRPEAIVQATIASVQPPADLWAKIESRIAGAGLPGYERAVLAGGCFWGMQDLIRRQEGVISTRVGYTGGDVRNATYRNHGTHAEAIEIIFDPSKLSYRKLLEFFFQIHDPTTLNRQGNDVGKSYRSAIFYMNDEQKRAAEGTIADIEASGLWPGRIVTEVTPLSDFWEAEPEHQDYLQRIPNGHTCHFVRPDWRLRAGPD